MKRFSVWLSGLVLLITIVSCSASSIKPYQNSLAKNLVVSLSKNSDTDIKARVDIFPLDKNCYGNNEGAVRFNKDPVQIGIPDNKQIQLSFYFLSSDWLYGAHFVKIDTLIRTRSGYRYEAKLSYVDSAYEVNLFEINRRSGKRRSIPIVNINACH